MATILGIDPGVRGGLAVVGEERQVHYLRAFTPDMTEEQLVRVIQVAVQTISLYPPNAVFIEKVQFMRGDGGQGAFTFGGIFGLLRGAVLAFGHRPNYVYPTMWQSRLECLTGGNKNVSKARAQALFPREKITHAVADALLIAYFGQLALTNQAAR